MRGALLGRLGSDAGPTSLTCGNGIGGHGRDTKGQGKHSEGEESHTVFVSRVAKPGDIFREPKQPRRVLRGFPDH